MRLAAQFYTLRDFTTTTEGFYDALRRVKEIGYAGVQLSGVGCMGGDAPTVDAATARKWLDEFGLVCCATHRSWDQLLNQTAAEIEFHQTLGCTYTAIGGLWDYGQGPDCYHRFLSELPAPLAALSAAGIRFGYHNHSHEFVRNPETGKTCYEILMEGPRELQLEIDTYWVAHAGADPAWLLRRSAGRIPAVHLKDMEILTPGGQAMAPVGEGNLNWPAILDACQEGGTEWLIVEQDVCRRDPFDCLKSSFEFLNERV